MDVNNDFFIGKKDENYADHQVKSYVFEPVRNFLVVRG